MMENFLFRWIIWVGDYSSTKENRKQVYIYYKSEPLTTPFPVNGYKNVHKNILSFYQFQTPPEQF